MKKTKKSLCVLCRVKGQNHVFRAQRLCSQIFPTASQSTRCLEFPGLALTFPLLLVF
jgi:hypothetical protein